MARHKDANWSLGDKVTTWDECQLSVLMDIRDELKTTNIELRSLNTLLRCHNFTDIPRILRGIRRKLPVPKVRKRRVR